MLARAEQGRFSKSFMMVGLRGVGKTVLLNRILKLAEDRRYRALLVEAHEGASLPELIIPPLRQILIALDTAASVNAVVKRGLRVLKGFAKSIRLKHGEIEVGLSIDPEPGVADSGRLESDLPDLLVAVAEAAKARGTVVVLLIDEIQYLSEFQLGALVMGIHKVSQRQLPLLLIAAGLPQLVGNLGKSKSYAERLFDFPEIGPLTDADAYTAVFEPISKEGERIAKPAARLIVSESQGYPYFLQVWGYQTWDSAPRSPITVQNVEGCRATVLSKLDESFFRVRFDRLTPAERRYLRAMAELGAGPHRSGDIAQLLKVKVQSVAPLRSGLIRKGMIYSPAHGDTAFTVPLFDDFMKRQMPKL